MVLYWWTSTGGASAGAEGARGDEETGGKEEMRHDPMATALTRSTLRGCFLVPPSHPSLHPSSVSARATTSSEARGGQKERQGSLTVLANALGLNLSLSPSRERDDGAPSALVPLVAHFLGYLACLRPADAPSADDPLVPLYLLPWAVQTFVTTLTCLVELSSWEGLTGAEWKSLVGLYAPYLGLGGCFHGRGFCSCSFAETCFGVSRRRASELMSSSYDYGSRYVF